MKAILACTLAGLVCIAGTNEDAIADHAARAAEAQRRGDFALAATEWQAIVKLAPQVPEAHSNLGMMLHFERQYPQAIQSFQEALKLNPNLVSPHLFLGIDYYLTSHPNEAIPQFKQTLALEPSNAMARKWLAMSYFQLADFAATVAELSGAVKADSHDADLLFFLSRAYSKIFFQSYEAVRRADEASPYLPSLRSQQVDFPNVEDPTVARARALLAGGQGPEALAILNALAERKPRNLEYQYWLGKCSQILALRSLEAFLALSPDSYQAHQLKAEYFLAEGNQDQAIAEYREALSLKWNAIGIHVDIGNIFMGRHEYSEAIPEYEAELRLDPYSLVALERAGQAYAELHQPQQAEKYLVRAIGIDAHSFEALRALGKVYYERADYRNSVKYYRAAVDRAPGRDNAILFQLSKAYRQLGDTVEADRWLARFKQELAKEHEKVQREIAAGSRSPKTSGQAAGP